MVHQPLQTRVARINEHAEVVSAHYRRALANVEFYPAADKERLAEQICSEMDNFYKSVAMVRAGKFVREIQEEVCSEARSWVKGSMPAAIARYSFYQISDAELAERGRISASQIRVCQAQMTSALDTIAKVGSYDGNARTAEAQRVKEECSRFERAFTLYARGFSFVEIKELTGESIQSRVEDKTIPETLMKYAGYPLSEAAAQYRANKISALQSAAVKAFEAAKARQEQSDPTILSEKIKVWKGELKELDLVLGLYKKGLSITSIADLTGLHADGWIRQEQLPAKLARASLDLTSRDFRVPQHIDPDFACVLGALCATTRVFSPDGAMAFRHSDKKRLEQIKIIFERLFQTSLVEPQVDGQGFILRVGRSALVREILEKFGVKDRTTDVLPPYEILKYSDTCRAFVRGFLTFCHPHLDKDLNRFGVARSTQPNLLKAVAIGLYLEKIYPTIRESGGKVALVVADQRDFEALCDFAPSMLNEAEKEAWVKRVKREPDPIGSYDAYAKIASVLRGVYPTGVKLNFSDILSRAGIECDATQSVKTRIANWRGGIKPHVALRAKALEELIATLYPKTA